MVLAAEGPHPLARHGQQFDICFASFYQVPIDVTAGWAVSTVDTRSQFNSWVDCNNKVSWVGIEAVLNLSTADQCPDHLAMLPLSLTHTHTHTPSTNSCIWSVPCKLNINLQLIFAQTTPKSAPGSTMIKNSLEQLPGTGMGSARLSRFGHVT